MMRPTKKKSPIIAAIAILSSATVAFAAIKTAQKACAANGDLKSEDNGEFKTVLEDLVNFGTITHAEEVAIQSALKRAEATSIVNGNMERRENERFEMSKNKVKTKLCELCGTEAVKLSRVCQECGAEFKMNCSRNLLVGLGGVVVVLTVISTVSRRRIK